MAAQTTRHLPRATIGQALNVLDVLADIGNDGDPGIRLAGSDAVALADYVRALETENQVLVGALAAVPDPPRVRRYRIHSSEAFAVTEIDDEHPERRTALIYEDLTVYAVAIANGRHSNVQHKRRPAIRF